MSTEAERYEAAALLERMAVGDEGDQREQSRQLILRGGDSARTCALHALMYATDTVTNVRQAIETLGLLA